MKNIEHGGEFGTAQSPIGREEIQIPSRARRSRVRELRRGRGQVVAQICNLPYRRIAFCGAAEMPAAPGLSAGSQNAILRYGRLQICATKAGCETFQLSIF